MVAIPKHIEDLIYKITSIDIESDIVKSHELGSLSFAPLADTFAFVIKLIKEVQKVGFEFVTSNWIDHLQNKLRELYTIIERIKTFDTNIRNPSDERNGIFQSFDRNLDELLPQLLRILEISKYTDSAATESEHILKSLKDRKTEVDDLVKNFEKEIEGKLKIANQSMQRFGMRQYAQIFADESKLFATSSKWWLRYTILLLTLTVVIGIFLLFYSKELDSSFGAIQFIVTKVLIISALFYGVSICIKTYRAQKHNEILNKHRHNALMTFEAFTTDDVQTKNAILLEATHTIFGNQSTGYNLSDVSEGDLPSKIIELVKTPTSSK